ncbi:MAG: hypothetical protein OIN88_08095 [Candidatus Methanoperedens sp.]|nr:hypothetical protein [Candidatus Methanoperedens sp.]MCZ7360406.1 hypothetical protein [Candidatus Methanoperedens sp.]HLB70183.1 hypothetical protein [Candidatus Methanoperedens sp.]
MKSVYIILVLVVAALALGCVGKQGESPTVSPVGTTISPVETTVSPGGTPATSTGEDVFGVDEDIQNLDAMLNDASLDTSLSTTI